MAAGSKKRKRRNPATRLTDDLVVEILSRLPVKSLCRFKCVSRHWRGLISDPDHRKKLPQTLAGFFYHTTSRERFPESARHFTNVTGRGVPLICPSLSFLPGYADIVILDCCNGLLLCRSRAAAGATRYIVCNPATEEWAALPESSQAGNIGHVRLGFDRAVSPHFHVFEFLETDEDPLSGYIFVEGVEIYSSETGGWVHKHQDVLVVDTEGKAWRTIPVPHGNDDGFIGQSQGHLYYFNTIEDYDFKLTAFVLEDYSSGEWIFKHSVKTSKLLGLNRFGQYNKVL